MSGAADLRRAARPGAAGRGRVAAALLAGVAGLGGLARPAAACAVCYGAADSGMTAGMNGAILTLLAVIGAVQAGFIALFVSFWRRARRHEQLKSRFHMIHGGSL